MSGERWKIVKEIVASALDLSGAERSAYLDRACAADHDLRGEVDSLLAMDGGGDFLEETQFRAPTPAAPTRIGIFKIDRELGRGGMGIVYLAHRDDGLYEQQLAIKVLKRGMDTDSLLARFRTERQILARLRHVNITALFDGGVTPEGLPYFAMEYIPGEPIDSYARKLPVPDRLRLFLQVCSAVEHAHANLILHRDIKPANILVDRNGVCKLLDFGIAKLLEEDPAGNTLTGLRPFTPQAASPEQRRGEPLTTASDIYSLGLLLKTLTPDVRSGDDVATIASRCTQDDPARRYASVLDLSADVRRFLAGRPILARPDSLAYTAGKFLRRHRGAVAIATLVVLALGLAVGSALVQARRAHNRFNELRAFAHSVVFDMNDAMVAVPGTTVARELLVRRSTQYLEALARDAGSDRSLLRELAEAEEKLGTVQGDRTTAYIGDMKQARNNLLKSADLYQRLGDRPGASRVAGKLSLLSITNGDFAGGIEWARRSGSDSDLSYALLQSGDLPGALAAGQRHLATLDRLPATPENQRKTASFLVLLGQIQGRNGLMPAGVESFRRAREIHRKLLEAAPNDLTLKGALALDYQVLARVMIRRGDPAGAIGFLRQTLELQSDVLNADPRNERSQNSLRITVSLLSNELARVGQSEEALNLGRRSLDIAEAMNRHNPTARAQADIADAHLAIGEALEAGHQSAAAMAEYKIALDILTAMDVQSTLSIDDRAELNTVKRKLQPASRPPSEPRP